MKTTKWVDLRRTAWICMIPIPLGKGYALWSFALSCGLLCQITCPSLGKCWEYVSDILATVGLDALHYVHGNVIYMNVYIPFPIL